LYRGDYIVRKRMHPLFGNRKSFVPFPFCITVICSLYLGSETAWLDALVMRRPS